MARRLTRLVGLEAQSRARVLLSATIGATVGLAVSRLGPWQLAVVAGWDTGALAFLAAVWLVVARLDGPATAAIATREDETRATAGFLLLGASVTSLAGVVLTLMEAGHRSGALEMLLTGAAMLTVVVSWAVVHTVFTLRYAHLYYLPPCGGIDFPTTDDPDYGDFAYFAFTVGMTYQVADTALQDGKIRRAVLRHAMLSYLFGTVIVAMTINVLAGFIH